MGEATSNRLFRRNRNEQPAKGTDHHRFRLFSCFASLRCRTGRDENPIRPAMHPSLECDGYHYFIASLQKKGVDGWIPLGVQANAAILFDPMTKERGAARIRRQKGKTEVYLQIPSGGSLILQTFTEKTPDCPAWNYIHEQPLSISLDHGWTLSFPESEPAIPETFMIDHPVSWTTLDHPDARRNMATGRYSLTFRLPEMTADDWILDLGDVRESARVYINGQSVGTVWAVPFRLKVGKYLEPGINGSMWM